MEVTQNNTPVEKEFNKYKARGSYHWKEMLSKDIRVSNPYHQAHYDWILKIAGDVKGKKVLDIGCGDGVLSFFFAKAGAEVVGVDNEEYGLQYAQENLDRENKKYKNLTYAFVNTSAYTLPFEEGSFDFVVCSEVIEHVQEPEKMIAEMARVTKKGGVCILTTPHRITEIPQDINHVKEYFPGEIKKLLSHDFTEVHIKLTHHIFWHALFIYSFPGLGRRPYGKWFINLLGLIFKWNPFMIDYIKPEKLDSFTTICAWGIK